MQIKSQSTFHYHSGLVILNTVNNKTFLLKKSYIGLSCKRLLGLLLSFNDIYVTAVGSRLADSYTHVHFKNKLNSDSPGSYF